MGYVAMAMGGDGLREVRGVGAGDAANAKPRQTLIAAIAETPRGTMFIQLFGGNDYAIGQRNALIDFVRSMK